MRKMVADEPMNEHDTRIVNDEMYYTTKGAMKKMNVGRNKLLSCVRNGEIEVFFHPTLGQLYSPAAVSDWVRKLTKFAPRKK